MFGAILAAVPAIESAISGGGHLSSRDRARVNGAHSAEQKALLGDQSALAYMIQQSDHSATQVGKQAYRTR